MGSPKDQAGKWLTSRKLLQFNCTSMHSSLWAPGSMRMMSCSLHAGHHSSWHRREDLHAISNVRYDLRWRSLPKWLNLVHFIIFTLKIISPLRRLCTIWNTYCKFHTKIIHLIHLIIKCFIKLTWLHRYPFTWSCLGIDEINFGLILPQK